jgi:hypothetical protein
MKPLGRSSVVGGEEIDASDVSKDSLDVDSIDLWKELENCKVSRYKETREFRT